VGNEELDAEAEVARRCKTGRPLPLVDLRVVNEQMEDVKPTGDQVGEIVVRSPWLTQGYLKDRNNSENLWKGGYLHTGDVAAIDGNKYVNITDRIKDVIKIGGEWLSSLELEDVINLHPDVAEVAVIGMEDQKWGERPLALIVPKKDHKSITEKEMVNHVKSFIDKGMLTKLALLLHIRKVEVIDKTSVGKINKKLLREKYL
jgi:fatty-acyl-CoA synthase